MGAGIVYALAACFIWGLIFIVPQFMTGFSSIEVALGRYLFYGVVSLLIFAQAQWRMRKRYSGAVWLKAFYFSLISTIGYYTFVVLSLRFSTPSVCALILGISPITIAFYGNWMQRETTFKSLIFPSLLILLGLIAINIPHFQAAGKLFYSHGAGLACGFVALLAWSWYVVANARFLKEHQQVRSSDWCTLIGVATFFWVLLFALVIAAFFQEELHLKKYITLSIDLTRFLIGSAILGVLCSWVGAWAWNRASLRLPVSLAGQLTIFETLFGVLFIFILQQQMPPAIEAVGIGVMLLAITLGVRQFSSKRNYNDQLKPH